MTIVTKDHFVAKSDDDLIWRRRELTDFRSVIEKRDLSPLRRTSLTRAGVALLYAHWEGYVKVAGSAYLEFVSNQRNRGSDLKPNFLAIKLKAKISEVAKSKKNSSANDLIDFFCTKLSANLRLPHKGIVDTESNLSSKVLEEILWTLGIPQHDFETKSNLIDSSLLNRRNHIAHGSPLDVDLTDYLALHSEVLGLMDRFRTLLQNAVVNDDHLRK